MPYQGAHDQRPAGGHAMLRIVTTLILCTAMLGGCGRVSGWFDRDRGPATLEPEDGYPTAADDRRMLVPAIASARFATIPDGRLLVVVANTPSKGWWDVALVTEIPQPEGRFLPDENGVLNLRLVGHPPPPDSPEARMPADPRVDSITVALPLSHAALAGIEQIRITAAQNTITLRR